MQRPASTAELIRSAESDAPISLSHKAAVVVLDAAGNSRVLRQGSSSSTCLPESPCTPGPDPMCGDANAIEWAGRGTPGWGGLDPYGTSPDVLQQRRGHPDEPPARPLPNTSQPDVMWSGTPHGHLMQPGR
jgi:hypothetical protein